MEHLPAEVLRLLRPCSPRHLKALSDVLGQSGEHALESEHGFDQRGVRAISSGGDDHGFRVDLNSHSVTVNNDGAGDGARLVRHEFFRGRVEQNLAA